MKVIVHIGTEKTGTTSIQEFLYLNKDKLQDFGFYFIQSAGEKNNRALVSYCMDESKDDDFWIAKGIGTSALEEKRKFKREFITRFVQEIGSLKDSIHTVIISSEHFHSRLRMASEVQKLKDVLSEHFSEVKIICYLREQASLCTSLYSTGLRSGGVHLLQDRAVNICTPKNIYYNYDMMLRMWEDAFGIDSLNVALFDRSYLLNRDLLDDFTVKLSAKLIGNLDTTIQKQNESISYVGQLIMRAINNVFPRYDNDLVESYVGRKCAAIIYREYKGKGEVLPFSIQKKIYNDFSESNDTVRQKFFPDLEKIFELNNECSYDNSADERLTETLEFIFKEILGILQSRPNSFPGQYADLFRDVAMKIEKEDLHSALQLMKLAHDIRPAGPSIKEKLEEYRNRLGAISINQKPE